MASETTYSRTKAAQTAERITKSNAYKTNTYYFDKDNLFVWYENTRGYLHILKPSIFRMNGRILWYRIKEYLLTKDDTLKEVSLLPEKYERREAVIEAMQKLNLTEVLCYEND